MAAANQEHETWPASKWKQGKQVINCRLQCLQDILIGQAKLTGPNTVKYNLPGRVDVGGEATAKDIMLATGSVPFVPPGIPIDGKTVSFSASDMRINSLCKLMSSMLAL